MRYDFYMSLRFVNTSMIERGGLPSLHLNKMGAEPAILFVVRVCNTLAANRISFLWLPFFFKRKEDILPSPNMDVSS